MLYRGDILRLTDEEAAVVPIDTPRYQFGISASGAFPASSDGNPAREDLPDLDFLIELGPELAVAGPAFAGGAVTTELGLQGRAVFSLDVDEVAYRGLVFEPELRAEVAGLWGDRLEIDAGVGPIFATEALHDYFYEVPARFARPGRPAFDADGGYLGTDVSLSLSAEITERLQLFGGGFVSLHPGAANRDSPLYERDVTATAFAGFAVTLARSRRSAN